jgi:hypothetical protein
MSPVNEALTDFERNARLVLEESVTRIDARTRSRLNQARQAALTAAAGRRRSRWWSSFTLMPAGAVAAALLVSFVLWHRQPGIEAPVLDARASPVEDMDLLADGEGLDLMEGWDGSFYEWAAAQTDGNGESEG